MCACLSGPSESSLQLAVRRPGDLVLGFSCMDHDGGLALTRGGAVLAVLQFERLLNVRHGDACHLPNPSGHAANTAARMKQELRRKLNAAFGALMVDAGLLSEHM